MQTLRILTNNKSTLDNYVCEQREEEYIIIIDVFVGNIRYIKIADNELYL